MSSKFVYYHAISEVKVNRMHLVCKHCD